MDDTAQSRKGLSAWFEGLGVALRDAVLITVAASLVGLLINLVHPEKIPYIADKEYQILVPCPEPGGEVTAMQASDPDLGADWIFVIDARTKKDYQAWKFRQAVNLTFDYLEPIPDDVFEELTTRIVRSKARRVVVYGDGGQPDSGEQLGKEISGRGIKNVYFVEGGAPALQKAPGGGQ